MNDAQFVTKKEAVKLLGITIRQVSRYLAAGELSIDHIFNGKVMIDVTEVYSLREKIKNRKRGN